MLFTTVFCGYLEPRVFCQLPEKLTTNVSCQLNFRRYVSCQLKFWPFVSCQLTPSRPSYYGYIVSDKNAVCEKAKLKSNLHKECQANYINTLARRESDCTFSVGLRS